MEKAWRRDNQGSILSSSARHFIVSTAILPRKTHNTGKSGSNGGVFVGGSVLPPDFPSSLCFPPHPSKIP
jgi:hypothetical protein